MTTIVLVHGTGGRQPNTKKMYARIEQKLHERRADLAIVGCYWGDEVGAKLNAKGASIPGYDTTRAIVGPRDLEYQIALWDQLYRDPLYELRLLGIPSSQGVDFIPGQISPGEELNYSLVNMRLTDRLRAKLEEAGVADLFEDARQDISSTAAYIDAVRGARRPLIVHRSAVARAVVAQMITTCEERNRYEPLCTDADLRDEVVDLLIIELGDVDRGLVSDWVVKPLLGIATWYARNHRGSLTDAVHPAAGDIVLYQGNGGPVRKSIRDTIAAASPPVVVLAHSLGGVASVDLLAMEHIDAVKLLITVGSQAPILYEMNALHGLPYGQPLPAYFPAWLNIYDQRDFLSYIGAKLFHETPGKVQDVLVDNRQPFPQAHSSYWENPSTWNAVDARLTEEHL